MASGMPIALSLAEDDVARRRAKAGADLMIASAPIDGGEREVELVAPEIHCAGCIARIERALQAVPDVTRARVNLSTKRVRVRWRGHPPPLIETLVGLGFSAHTADAPTPPGEDAERRRLVRALAVAGFAAGNIMLLSVSVWSGASESTRILFHWLSALIALPAVVYSGAVFFRSAWRSVRRGQTNMDVPISIGVLTAFGLSLYETITHGAHAYFDAAVMLLFFLLIGRTLDHVMRERALTAVRGLQQMMARSALVIDDSGGERRVPVDQIEPGMVVLIAAGERVPLNASVLEGASELDLSLVSGESRPVAARVGDTLWAGALNLTGPLKAVVRAPARESFLADMLRMMEAAEQGRSSYRRIADRAARLYAPAVHVLALLTLIGWWIVTGDPHRAITIAVAVLIITCPCALGLAVPMAHIAAARRLFDAGVLMKDGAALERLAEIDTAILDKTGTLTLPEPRLVEADERVEGASAQASALARYSAHPNSRALAGQFVPASLSFEKVREHPGEGVEAVLEGVRYRLGRPNWALTNPGSADDGDAVVFSRADALVARFRFEQRLRPGAEEAVAEFARLGVATEIVSGDHDEPVHTLARKLALRGHARSTPAQKVERLKALAAAGHKTLMVGDGLNDAPALRTAHASMAASDATDIGRAAADFVFLRPNLLAAPETLVTARVTARRVRQNIALAVIYNLFAVPLAVAGLVTPLIAAIAMSASSLLVVANTLRPMRSVARG